MKLKVLAGMLVATAAFAFTPIDDLNEAVVGLLKPLNNKLTKAEILFTALEVNEKHALKAGVNAAYSKKGELTDLELNINELSYDMNGTRKGPRALFDLAVQADLLAIIDQEMINELGPMISEIITDMAAEFLDEYGSAAEVEVRTEDEKYDDEGNLVSLRVYGKVKVDLKKLPEGVPVDSVPVKEAEVTLAAGLTGISGEGYLIMNPDGRAFSDDNKGLKEFVEALLSQDKDTMGDLQDLAVGIDEFISDAVNNGFKDDGGDY